MKHILQKYLTDNSDLTETDQNKLLDLFHEKRIKKNDFWIKQGESCDDIAFLADGIIRLFHEDDAEEISLEFVFPNSFMAPIANETINLTNLWNFQALTDCDLLLINKEIHKEVMFKDIHSFEFYEKQLKDRFLDQEKRLFSHLNLNAEQRFEKLFSEQPQIFNLVPLKHIASSLGITPETLSRIRNKFVKGNS